MTRPRSNPNAPADTQRDVEDRFIENWAAIAALWGVNRSIGRIHAALYLAKAPMHAEAIRDRLLISHGNVSTSIRDLLAWGVIRKVHLTGERKAHYEAEQDPWTWFHECIRERRRREVVPVLEALNQVAAEAKRAAKGTRGAAKSELNEAHARIDRFARFSHEFVDLIDVFLAVGAGKMGKVFRSVARWMPKDRS
ncbi:MAG: hypothetical protein CMJ83_14015 [Planctomycetes bacterium]|nr:hypothetical protein [Planctomycetota bacterium]